MRVGDTSLFISKHSVRHTENNRTNLYMYCGSKHCTLIPCPYWIHGLKSSFDIVWCCVMFEKCRLNLSRTTLKFSCVCVLSTLSRRSHNKQNQNENCNWTEPNAKGDTTTISRPHWLLKGTSMPVFFSINFRHFPRKWFIYRVEKPNIFFHQ